MAVREWALPAFQARMQDYARRLGLAGFWQWWARELDALIPAAPRAALARRRMRPVLVFAGDSATLWRPATENGQPVMAPATTIALTGDAAAIAAAGRAALAPPTQVAYGSGNAAARIVVSLAPRDMLRRNLVLPAAIEENFRQALTYDLDRHTPFKAEELYFDAAIVARDTARNTITVDLAAARRALVDPVLKHVAAWGAEVAAIVPEPPQRAAASRLNLLPADARTSRSRWSRWQFWVPIALLAVATLAAVVIPLWQKRDYVMQLSTLADQARGRAAISETLRAELDARAADYNTALERKYLYPGALQVVDAVSKLLPDDTWLTQFELKSMAKGKETQREVLLRGESANAGHLVQLFEESQLFAQAAPRSPTTKIQPGPGEIFDLGAQLKPRPLPAPLALVVAATPAETAQPATPAPAAPAAPLPAAAAPATPSSAPPAPAAAMPGGSSTAAPPAAAAPPAPPPTTAPTSAPTSSPPRATTGSAPGAGSAAAATDAPRPGTAAPGVRVRPPDVPMPPAAGPVSPGLAPGPATDVEKAPGMRGQVRP
ncbi:MAG: PilN domain-containing protein [Casimicrobiaceae bacterium]